jgi:hypothetical protein
MLTTEALSEEFRGLPVHATLGDDTIADTNSLGKLRSGSRSQRFFTKSQVFVCSEETTWLSSPANSVGFVPNCSLKMN